MNATQDQLEFLDELRASGDTNMYGAGPYLLTVFPELSKQEAKDVVLEWMRTFSQRHVTEGER